MRIGKGATIRQPDTMTHKEKASHCTPGQHTPKSAQTLGMAGIIGEAAYGLLLLRCRSLLVVIGATWDS